jgi:hypothetical protein
MKLIIYTLLPDGTVPNYVLDGGYLACVNNNTSPQDLDLIGVATDEAEETSFANEPELLAYVKLKNLQFIDSLTDKPIKQETIVSYIWNKLQQ